MFDETTAACPGRPAARVTCRFGIALTALLLVCIVLPNASWAQEAKPATPGPAATEATKPAGDLAPVEFKLPKPAFKGTPKHVPPGTNLEEPRKGPRPPLMAPRGVELVSKGKPVTSSDTDPIIGSIKLITDGDNSADEGAYVELGPGVQWVQVDLKQNCEIWGILVWHYHANARVYHDVLVQVADDPDFIKNVRTLFNNDHDNSAGLGLGRDKEFWETYEGKLVEANGATARYVRLFSKGSTADDQNHYVEVEVYAKPVK